MTALILARHGETDWNLNRRVQGHSDTPLNGTGRAQARALARELTDEPITAVYASDLLRAHDTARIVAAGRGLDVIATRDLRERHFGTWEGLTAEEVLQRHPDAARGRWGDGESPDEMTGRVLRALYRIAHAHEGQLVLVVSHGGPMRAVLTHCGVDEVDTIGNCHVMRLDVAGSSMRVGWPGGNRPA